MKKKFLLPILIALPLLVGGVTAAVTYSSFESDKQYIAVYAEELESEEPTSEEGATEEEISKWKEYYEKALQMYNDIANKQVANTTVGGIISAAVSAIVSFLFSMLNRHRIMQATDTAKLAKEDYDLALGELKGLKEKYEITSPKLDKAIETFEKGSDVMGKLIEKTDKLIVYCEKSQENHDEDVQFLLEIISSSEELVRNGIAQKLNEKYGRK